VPSEQKDRDAIQKVKEHRDFPRLSVDAKVRLDGSAANQDLQDLPGEVSDLSLGGARLSTPAKLTEGDVIRVVPFAVLEDGHPLTQSLEFQVMWCSSDQASKWNDYGLAHKGSVLDVLHSWLGHLLLRQKEDSHLLQQRREHRRLRFDKAPEQRVSAKLSHDNRELDLTLLDVAPGGLLAQADHADLEVGMHLEVRVEVGDPNLLIKPLTGCVVDCHQQFDSTYYRIAFDPDSELEFEVLSRWAKLVDGELADS
jgi:c-di-GMP-binding flagellar brake protein YcgR